MKIAIVEDEKSLLEMIQLNLEMEGHQTLLFSDGELAFHSVKELGQCDLVILDVMLPKVNGLDICLAIRKISSVPVLFLSAKGTAGDRIQGLKQGANDYLPKPFDLEELLLRVNILLQNSKNDISKDDYLIGNKIINFTNYSITDLDKQWELSVTKKEIDLLRMFMENENKVISRNDILDEVWGKDQFPTTRTIDNYILNFRKIFEEDPKNPRYFHSIRGVGYKFTKGR